MPNLSIVSKEKQKVEFDPKIVQFVSGLQLYNPDEEIVFEEIISTEFLKALKEFYEGNEFDVEKFKVLVGYFMHLNRSRIS